jgi:5-methylcytosine-specific restriction protein A
VFRAGVLARDHVCVLCKVAIATVADHHPKSRADLEQLGMNPNDPAHGRGLCKPCHDTETARNQPGGWNMHN